MKKILLLIFLILLCATFVYAHPTSSNSPYDDWRMYGHDTGFTKFTPSNAPANISNTTVITRTFTGDADTSPVVIWDELYYFPYYYDYSANNAYKLNASNISQMLANSTNQYAISRSPSYYKDALYLQQDTYLYQINASNLSQIIDYEYIADSTGWSQLPVIFNNSVWTGAGNYNPYVRQFNASNISQAISSYYVYARPYDAIPVVGNYAYFYFSGTIYQASSSNISQVYRTVSCGDTNRGESSAVGDGYLYRICETGAQDTFIQFNASNISQQIANISINGTIPAIGNGYVYVASGVILYQLNSSNVSQQIATYNLTAGSSYTAPTVTPKYVFASGGNVMYQLNASNISQKIGNYTAGSTIGGSPVVSKGFLYFGSVDDKLYQLGIYNPLPALKIDFPADEKIYLNATEFNYSLMQNSTHAWDKCWHSNDSGVTNYSVQNAGDDFLDMVDADGWNTWTIYCNDSSGNLYTDYTTFYVDTDTPIFTNATNKTVNQTTALSHQITATDLGGVNCFSVNNSNFTISCSGLIQNNTFLTVGNYSLNISVYDYASHYNYTPVVVSVLDSVAPLLAIVSPVNNTNTSNSGLDINYSVSDAGTAVNTCWYSNDSFSINYTLVGCANITDVSWVDGVHNLRLWANDSSGNRNLTTLRFTVDTTPPVFNNLTNQTVTGGNSFSYQLNATDSTMNVSCFSVNDSNFAISCSGLLINNSALGVGSYSLNISVNDSVNNRNSSLLNIVVETRPIIGLTLITPIGNLNVTQNRTFDVSVNVSCSAADCGAINVTLDPTLNTAYNFTTCGISGYAGPTQANCVTNYTGTALAGLVNVSSGIQNWTVPVTGIYTIEVAGAKGAATYPGNGSKMTGTFQLTQGTVLQILVGQIGATSTYGGGGGGSFVARGVNYSVATPLIVAGGGGGGSGSSGSYYLGINATTITNGTNGQGETANKGTNGSGGLKGGSSYGGGGGGGFYGNGTSGSYGTGGKGFIYGGAGSTSSYGTGGFGGGGGNGYYGGGGGGGYSGGGGGNYDLYGGGGGGSYNAGTSQVNLSGTNFGNGYVTITYSGGKGGTVSMNSSATPFYTTNQNPYNLTLNNGESRIITWTVNATGETNNTYEFFVYANKTSDLGIGNITSTWNVTITNDTGTTPTISISYPINNGNYTSNVSEINYSVTGNNLSRCWYSINNGVTNSSDVQNGTNFTGVISSEGANNWRVYCNNTNGNVSSSLVGFTKDTSYPQFSNYGDNNASIYIDGTALFNVSLLNTNGTVILSINNINYSATNNSEVFNVSVSGLSSGNYNYFWYAYGNGSLKNINYSTTRVYNVLSDNTPPFLDFVSPTPTNATSSTNTSFKINTTISETSLGSMIYNWNGTNFTIYNDSLVLMMNFDNVSSLGENSTRVVDLSKYQNNGTAVNGAFYNTSGKYNGAYQFDGVNDYIDLGNSTSTQITNNITLSAWVKTSATSNAYRDVIANQWNYQDSGIMLSTYGASTIHVPYSNGSVFTYLDATYTFSDGNWHFIATTFSSGTLRIYADGNQINSSTSATLTRIGYNNVNKLLIGKDSGAGGTEYFNGSIDEARIWNRSLSASEIYQQYISNLNKINSSQWYLYVNQSKNTTSGLADGNYTYSVFASDIVGNLNQTIQRTFNVDNSPRIYLSCEAGGPYQQNSLAFVIGSLSNRTSSVSGATVNLSLYKSGVLSTTRNLTTLGDGSFSTNISGLPVGNYILNGNTSAQGLNATCADSFSIGSSASLVLNKIATINSIDDDSISYNISLITINKGGSDATSVIMNDADSTDSPYMIRDLAANSSYSANYIKTYLRNSSLYNVSLAIANITAGDPYSSSNIEINSSAISLVVPPIANSDPQLTLVKNIYYNSENSTSVNYSVSIDVVNSGGIDLQDINLIDSDLDIIQGFDLNRTQAYNYSGYLIVDKAASNTNKLFAKASAVAEAETYLSNQIQVRIPGYGGPADAIVSAPALVETSSEFSTTIQVLNMNPDIGQDFTIDYWITNAKNDDVNYSSGQQTIYVAASGTSNLVATLTSPPVSGNYKFKTIVSWAGGIATAYDSFLVTSIGTGEENNETEEDTTEETSSGGGATGNVIAIVCNSPYIRHASDCCLDTNLNKICDSDENIGKANITEAPPYPDSKNIENKSESDKNIFRVIKDLVSQTSQKVSSSSIAIKKSILGFMFIFGLILVVSFFICNRRRIFRKRDKNLLSNNVGIDVYSSSGEKIGKVVDIYINQNMVYGWMIEVEKNIAKEIEKEKILVRHEFVQSIGEVMILHEKIEEKI